MDDRHRLGRILLALALGLGFSIIVSSVHKNESVPKYPRFTNEVMVRGYLETPWLVVELQCVVVGASMDFLAVRRSEAFCL